MQSNPSHDLLAQEIAWYPSVSVNMVQNHSHRRLPDIPDINLFQASLRVRLDVDIDWEMSIYVAHLVLEAFGDTYYQIVDKSLDSS